MYNGTGKKILTFGENETNLFGTSFITKLMNLNCKVRLAVHDHCEKLYNNNYDNRLSSLNCFRRLYYRVSNCLVI